MIGRIEGRLLEKNPPAILVDANGVGYEIDVPMSTFYQLPAISERVILLTHLVVREDAHHLFGFATPAERAAFRELIRISGVGARTALSVLSGLSVTELAQAVTLQESGRLTRIPGIGKKTAERLLLELRESSVRSSDPRPHRRPAMRTPTSCMRCSRSAITSARPPPRCARCQAAPACRMEYGSP